ncbi:MAG TPA: fibronectin type III domain-containing protein [Acidimicrobiales bacterium]|jgi:hypothetical protein|nr:fibronectin type III domain-containing protein [Acidimicrobiales bacterium]
MRFLHRPFGRKPTAFGAASMLVASAIALTFGHGHSPNRLDLFSGNAWLASNKRGQVVRVNGATGKPDAGVDVGKKGQLQIVQDGDFVVVRDASGNVRRIDTRNLAAGTAQSYGSAAFTVVVGGGHAYAVDQGKGEVRSLDGQTLRPQGRVVDLGGSISSIIVDDTGTAWAAVPAKGSIVSIRAARIAGTHHYGQLGDQAHLTRSGSLIVVVDETSGKVGTVGDGDVHLVATGVTGEVLAAPSDRTGPVYLVAPGARRLIKYEPNSEQVSDVRAPELAGHDLGAPQQVGGQVYLPDYSTGGLVQIDTSTGGLRARIPFLDRAGRFDLFVANGNLWANDADGSQALVIDQHGNRHSISKYHDNLPGLAPAPTSVTPPSPQPVYLGGPSSGPPAPTPLPTPGPTRTGSNQPLPTLPTHQPPGTPTVTANAGDANVSATWSVATNGAILTGYTVTLDPAPPKGSAVRRVAATSASTSFAHLKNGTTYTVTVVANTSSGDSPAGQSAPVTPRAGVPHKPVIQQAAAGDGAIHVTWSQPTGSTTEPASAVTGYTLTATPAAGGSGSVTATASTSPAAIANLANGTAYRVTITANAANGTSATSDPSAAVTPIGKPAAPTVTATASKPNGNTASVTLQIRASGNGGSPITKYRLTGAGTPNVVAAGPKGNANLRVTVAAGQKYTWTASAVNAAGQGPAGSASANVDQPGPAPGTTITIGFKGRGFSWIGPRTGQKWASGGGTHVYYNYFQMNGGASTVNWLGGCRAAGNNSQHTGASWTASIPSAGRWKIEVRVPGGANDPRGDTGLVNGTRYTLPNGSSVVTGGGPGWLNLGTVKLGAGSNTVRVSDNNTIFNCSGQNVAVYLAISDARFVYVGS